MRVCMCAHVYVCACVCAYECVCMHVCVGVCACTCVRMCVCTCVCACMCMCTSVYMCVCVWGSAGNWGKVRSRRAHLTAKRRPLPALLQLLRPRPSQRCGEGTTSCRWTALIGECGGLPGGRARAHPCPRAKACAGCFGAQDPECGREQGPSCGSLCGNNEGREAVLVEPVSNEGKCIQRFPEEPQCLLVLKAPRAGLRFAPD